MILTIETKIFGDCVREKFNIARQTLTIEKKVFRDCVRGEFKCCEIDHDNRNKHIQRWSYSWIDDNFLTALDKSLRTNSAVERCFLQRSSSCRNVYF